VARPPRPDRNAVIQIPLGGGVLRHTDRHGVDLGPYATDPDHGAAEDRSALTGDRRGEALVLNHDALITPSRQRCVSF